MSDLYCESLPSSKPASLHDSGRGSPEPHNHFHDLVADINRILGPCSGLDSAEIDVNELKAIMGEYQSCEAEWEPYAFSDSSRGYTRNLVDNCNGKSNLLVLVWSPGKGSPIHDHANAHCIMKILKGSLRETLYAWPCESSSGSAECAASPLSPGHSTAHTCSFGGSFEPGALPIKRSTIYGVNGVTYMSDRLGLHRVENASPEEFAVSLHLYTPPNAAKYGCHIFDESTGRKSHVSQCHFFSEFGVKV